LQKLHARFEDTAWSNKPLMAVILRLCKFDFNKKIKGAKSK